LSEEVLSMSNGQIHISTSTHQSSIITHHLIFVPTLTGAAVAAWLCASGRYREAAATAVAAVALGFVFSARIRIETLMIAWFATSPLLSYFVRIPTDKSIITFNRASIGLALIALLFRWRPDKPAVTELDEHKINSDSTDTSLNQSVSAAASRFEIAWAVVSVIALASAILYGHNTPFAVRMAVDSFMLPLAAFHIARCYFDTRGRRGLLVVAAIGLAFFLLAVGAFEFITGANLFQYKGSVIEREDELRVNGPFSADVTLANVSLLLALFLIAAPRIFNARLDATAEMLRRCAIVAAIIASMLPMFRTIAAAIIAGLIVMRIASKPGAESQRRGPEANRRRGRAAGRWLALGLLVISVGFVMIGPLAIEERLKDPRNAFGRLATWEAAAAIALEQPLTGVGLTNYGEYFYERRRREDRWVETFMETRAANSPHSNWLWIASELGLVVFALYVLANVSLFQIGYRALKRAARPDARAAAACFIALVVAYWIPGLTLASGYYSDLNLYLFFMLGLLSNKFLVSSS
jgi:hypothetical protein